MVGALLVVGGGANLLVLGGAVGGVVVAHCPVVGSPPLNALSHLLHHPKKLLRL